MPPRNDDPFENFLRRFEPRRPRALPAMQHPPRRRSRLLLAIAALILIGLALSLRQGAGPAQLRSAGTSRQERALPAVTLGELNEIFRRHPERFDAQLTEASHRLLPDVEEPGGLLHVLAGE